MIFLCTSAGNDSWALVQWLYENWDQYSHEPVTCVYNNTGMAHPGWHIRVDKMRDTCKEYGFSFAETDSIGLIALAKQRKAWPRDGMQFCTQVLKREPTLELMMELDPDCEGTVMVGVRREESRRRANFPRRVHDDPHQDGRDSEAPLVLHTTAMRDELLARAGVEILPHRSQECYPCVNSNRADIRRLDENRIRVIEIAEDDMGYGKDKNYIDEDEDSPTYGEMIHVPGKKKTFFRPYKFMGAVGIREVHKWAWASHGKYDKDQEDMFGYSGCDGGYCE